MLIVIVHVTEFDLQTKFKMILCSAVKMIMMKCLLLQLQIVIVRDYENNEGPLKGEVLLPRKHTMRIRQ